MRLSEDSCPPCRFEIGIEVSGFAAEYSKIGPKGGEPFCLRHCCSSVTGSNQLPRRAAPEAKILRLTSDMILRTAP